MWLLARRLTGSAGAAAVAAVLYAFCPYFFAHTPHIQLLMGGGVPIGLLLIYGIAEAPSVARGAALGVALAVQALACAYYGIFAGMLVGYAAIVLGFTRRRWRELRYWLSIATGARLRASFLSTLRSAATRRKPAAFPRRQRPLFCKPGKLSRLRRACTSMAARHHPGLAAFQRGAVPGFLALTLAAVGLFAGIRSRSTTEAGTPSTRETLFLFGTIGLLAFWASFGPAAGLYALLYYTIPLFSFLRAPSRLGPVVMMAIATLAALGVRQLFARSPRQAIAATALTMVALLELNNVPFAWERAPALPQPYTLLAQLPRAPVAEFPFYGGRVAYHLHTQYMLFSTAHWFPLVNGYSDYFPQDFRDAAVVLDSFPSNDSFAVLRRRRVRYLTIHWDMFGPRRAEIEERLRPFLNNLRPLSADRNMTLYEVVAYP